MAEVTDGDRAKAMQIMAWDPLPYEGLAQAVEEGGDPDDRDSLELVDAIAAALAEEREKARAEVLAELGTCGDTLPENSVIQGTGLAVCELPDGHKGWHQMTDDPTLPPVRWIAAGESE